eukprot:TRINITY_DN805_c0_g1_i1.p1 TRINITY_DN805_c0_g1~~TRINITY_DN805_c0_g1_i1.p1  ORF type:complete len:290 (-),score=54.69 TRINITY_DN805_c0_g1_i1:452-1321(-)
MTRRWRISLLTFGAAAALGSDVSDCESSSCPAGWQGKELEATGDDNLELLEVVDGDSARAMEVSLLQSRRPATPKQGKPSADEADSVLEGEPALVSTNSSARDKPCGRPSSKCMAGIAYVLHVDLKAHPEQYQGWTCCTEASTAVDVQAYLALLDKDDCSFPCEATPAPTPPTHCSDHDADRINKAGPGQGAGSFFDALMNCGQAHYNPLWGLNKAKTKTCLSQKLGLSDTCATCYTQGEAFALKNCKFSCLKDVCADKCIECGRPSWPIIDACTGRMGPYPDKKYLQC